jgi:hypothetical protein
VEPGIDGPLADIPYSPDRDDPLFTALGELIADEGIPAPLEPYMGGDDAGMEGDPPGIPLDEPPGIPAIPGELIPPGEPPELTAWNWSGRSTTRVTSTGMLEFAHWASNFGSRR